MKKRQSLRFHCYVYFASGWLSHRLGSVGIGLLLMLGMGNSTVLLAQPLKEIGIEMGLQRTGRQDLAFSSGSWTGNIPVLGLHASVTGERWKQAGWVTAGWGDLKQQVGIQSTATYQQWRGGYQAYYGNYFQETAVQWQLGIGITYQQIQLSYLDFGNQKDVQDQQIQLMLLGGIETALFGSNWKGRLGLEVSPLAYVWRDPGSPFASNDTESKAKGSIQSMGDWIFLAGELGLSRRWTSGLGLGLALRPSWMQYGTPQIQQWQPTLAIQFQYAW